MLKTLLYGKSHNNAFVAGFHLLELFRIVKSMGTKSRLGAAKADGRKQWGVTAHGHGASFGFDENAIK